jgi:hypothetical protein
LKILCDAGADTKVDNDHSALSYALTQIGYCIWPDIIPCIVEILCKGGADVNFHHGNVTHWLCVEAGNTHLHIATGTHIVYDPILSKVPSECVEILVSYGADVDSQNNAGRTPLHVAVAHSDLFCARVLVKHGARTDLEDFDGKTALICARSMGEINEEMVAFLEED